MKFKMAKNSLFAILLRSPWWISLLISVLISLGAFALLPREYAVVVMLGTFPFVVVAAIAAWVRPALRRRRRRAGPAWRGPSDMRQICNNRDRMTTHFGFFVT